MRESVKVREENIPKVKLFGVPPQTPHTLTYVKEHNENLILPYAYIIEKCFTLPTLISMYSYRTNLSYLTYFSPSLWMLLGIKKNSSRLRIRKVCD